MTGYDAAGGTSGHEVNQFKYARDAWGNVTRSIQDPNARPLHDQAGNNPGAPGPAQFRYDPASPEWLRVAGGLNRRVKKVVPAEPRNRHQLSATKTGDCPVWQRLVRCTCALSSCHS